MSFGNTHTPTLAEVLPQGKKARYQLPQRPGKGNAKEFYMTPDLEARFCKYFPTHSNREMMQLFGIGFSSLQRFKRELGLSKDMKVIRHKQAQMAKRICEENGYYDSMRGVAPSQQCKEAAARKHASGWHPLHSIKEKDPRRYKRIVKERADHLRELREKDYKRRRWGLDPLTNLTHSEDHYTKSQTSYRRNMRRKGYVTGNPNDRYGERFTIYYTEDTVRCPVAEAHASRYKMTILPMPHRQQSAIQLRYNNSESLDRVFL